MSDKNEFVLRIDQRIEYLECDGHGNSARDVADFRDAAVAEITRLRAENADLKDRIATALFDKAAVERGVMRLRADLAQRTAERDEARRMYCRAYTDLVVDPRLEELSLEDAAAIVADDLVWDCFDAKEVQR